MRDVRGRSVLWHALQVSDNAEMVSALLNMGAQVEEDDSTVSPLHQAPTDRDEPNIL